MDITKEDFRRYENVRASGSTNMFHIPNVMNLSGLDKDKILYIMKNYSELRQKYKPEG